MLVGESVTVAVDGASLLAGLTTLGTAIGGGGIGAVKMMLNYFTRQETKRDLVVRTLIESTNKNTEALTRLAERIGDCPHRTPRDEMRRELLVEVERELERREVEGVTPSPDETGPREHLRSEGPARTGR